MLGRLSRTLPLAVALAAFSGCGLMNRTVPMPASSSGGSGGASLNVVNRSSEPLFYFYASACSDSGWGPDQLGSSTIPSGTSHPFTVTPGCWDFKAKFQSGEEVERLDVRIAPGTTTDWTIRD